MGCSRRVLRGALLLSSIVGAHDLAAQLRPAPLASAGVRSLAVLADTWPAQKDVPVLDFVAQGGTLPPQDASVSPGNAALRSALIPGVGQFTLGQRRSWAYLGLELIGWGFYLDRRRAGADLRDAYRDFAWAEGRLQTGARVDGDFDYYETLSTWDRSGSFDADTGRAGIQPEDDASVFNGLIWSRAMGIFSVDSGAGPGDVRYDQAIAYYSERAYGTEFLWDWTRVPGARSTFAGIIESSDDRFRQASNALGFVIANHLVSAVDAFVSARSGLRVESRVQPGPAGLGLTVATSLRAFRR